MGKFSAWTGDLERKPRKAEETGEICGGGGEFSQEKWEVPQWATSDGHGRKRFCVTHLGIVFSTLSPRGFFSLFASCLKCKMPFGKKKNIYKLLLKKKRDILVQKKTIIPSCFPLFDYKNTLTWYEAVPVAHPLLQLWFLALCKSLKVFNLDLGGSGSSFLFPQPILPHLRLFLPHVTPALGVPPNADPKNALLSDTAQQQSSSCPNTEWDLALLSLIFP